MSEESTVSDQHLQKVLDHPGHMFQAYGTTILANRTQAPAPNFPLYGIEDCVVEFVFALDDSKIIELFTENPGLYGVHSGSFLDAAEQSDNLETFNTIDLMTFVTIDALTAYCEKSA